MPPAFALQGRAYAFQPAVEIPVGVAVTFAIENPPRWASFSALTGRLSGVPTADDLGSSSNITISMTAGASSVSIGPFSINVVAGATGTATVSWSAPLLNDDGSALTDLARYRIHFGTQSGDYTSSKDVGLGLATYVVDELTPASWYFVVTAVNSKGHESRPSAEASKLIQ
jgi:hypothetical protein